MADVNTQNLPVEATPSENGAELNEQPAIEQAGAEEPAPGNESDGIQQNGQTGLDVDAEPNNKRKLDEEADPDNDEPAKKKPVLDGAASNAPDPKAAVEIIACPRNMVGKLIGREGATIRELQQRSGARIQIDHASEGPNKTVTVTGTPEAVKLAKNLIKETLEPDTPSAADASKTVECPQGIVGRIIGRGGETIKALQSASNAHIVVDQNFPDGQPRKIHITGKPDFVERAVKMINEVINGEPGSVQNIIQKYGETRVIECPKQVVGRIIGKGGETIKGLQKESGASIQIDQSTDPSKVQVVGKRQAVEHALMRLRALINDEPYQSGQQFPAAGGYGAGMRPPFGAPAFNAPYPVAPGGYGGFGGYQGGAPAAGYYGYGGYPGYGAPQYGAYGAGYGAAAGAPAASSDPYSGYGAHAAGSGYQAAAGAGAGYGSAAASTGALWKEERDNEGRPYYYNTKTGVSQWEKPADMQ